MKIPPLLTQYLYANKRLDLPGIGTFLLDPSVIVETENSKQSKSAESGAITFENNPSIKEAPELIQFISAQTGKMKALAAADLDSHLELAQQFLNIGKPFLFEGIGNLVKVRTGLFTFTSGQISPDKIKEYSTRETSATSSTEDSFTNYKDILYPGSKQQKHKWRKPAAVILLLVGLGLALWGGYTVYKKTTANNKEAETATNTKEPETIPVKDTSTVLTNTSASAGNTTSTIVPKTTPIPSGNYKFVVEVANKQRGLLRLATLKSWGLDVKMETKDSLSYKLFFILPANAADTVKLKDSLGRLYTPYWGKAYVER